MPDSTSVSQVKRCIWVPLDGVEDCGNPAPYEAHDPAEPDEPLYWWPACVPCAAELRADGLHVRTIRRPSRG